MRDGWPKMTFTVQICVEEDAVGEVKTTAFTEMYICLVLDAVKT